jgi:hypothetical protein
LPREFFRAFDIKKPFATALPCASSNILVDIVDQQDGRASHRAEAPVLMGILAALVLPFWLISVDKFRPPLKNIPPKGKTINSSILPRSRRLFITNPVRRSIW